MADTGDSTQTARGKSDRDGERGQEDEERERAEEVEREQQERLWMTAQHRKRRQRKDGGAGVAAGKDAQPAGKDAQPAGAEAKPAATPTLEAQLKKWAHANPVDTAMIMDNIDLASPAELQPVIHNPGLIHALEKAMGGQADRIRARLARRLYEGHDPIGAWKLITGDDRARRQRYLDQFGAVAEQRAFEDAVIADGTNTSYMIRAFDSYWDVEALHKTKQAWQAPVIQEMHQQLKLLPEEDTRAQGANGRVWKMMILNDDAGAAYGGGEFSLNSKATTNKADMMGYGTALAADVEAGTDKIQVKESTTFAVGDFVALGSGSNTLSTDANYDRATVKAIAGQEITLGAALAHKHKAKDVVARIDPKGGSVKLAGPARAKDTQIQITNGTHFSINDSFTVGTGYDTDPGDPNYDTGTVTGIAGNTLTITPALKHDHKPDDVVTRTVAFGNASALSAATAPGATDLQVGAGTQFAVNDRIALGTGANVVDNDPNYESGRVTSISGNTVSIEKPLKHAHNIGDAVKRTDERGSGARVIRWLDSAVRHEIAHSVDEAIPDTVQAFTGGVGGWWTGEATEASFDAWVAAMGGEAAWAGATSGPAGNTTPITAADKALVRTAITHAVAAGKKSVHEGLKASHPVRRNLTNNVPVINAAEACLSRGDSFWHSPDALYATGGKCFSVSKYYNTFMYHKESIRAQRVSDYSLYSPAEFFAETYAVFYEEAGRPGVTEADYGRLLRDSGQKAWLRANIHNRGKAPAAAAAAGPAKPAPDAPGDELASGGEGVQQGGSGTGKKSHRPW